MTPELRSAIEAFPQQPTSSETMASQLHDLHALAHKAGLPLAADIVLDQAGKILGVLK